MSNPIQKQISGIVTTLSPRHARLQNVSKRFKIRTKSKPCERFARLFVSFCFMFVQKICQHFADIFCLEGQP